MRRPYAPTDIYQEESQAGEADRKYGRTIVVISVTAAALTGWLIGRNLPALAHLLDHHEGAVVGIATAVVALFTWALWHATMAIDEGARSTLAHLQTSSQQQLRAYICVEINDAEVIGPIPKSNAFELRPRVKNFGQTPAYDITVTFYIDLLPFPSLEESDLTRVDSPLSLGVLGPQQEMTLFVHTPKTKTFTDEEVSAMQGAGAKRLCVYGTIKYRDAFEGSPTTEFCYHITWSADRTKVIWSRNAKHNKAT